MVFQAEEADNAASFPVHTRSEAEEKKVVWLRDNVPLNITFCVSVPANSFVRCTVSQVRFSSDGPAKEAAVLFDGVRVRDLFVCSFVCPFFCASVCLSV